MKSSQAWEALKFDADAVGCPGSCQGSQLVYPQQKAFQGEEAEPQPQQSFLVALCVELESTKGVKPISPLAGLESFL